MSDKENKEYWLKEWVSCYPNADTRVLDFILTFLYHSSPTLNPTDACEAKRYTFRSGYCYYFALILKDAFQRGQICHAYPYGHIVWVDTDGMPYDVECVYVGEAEEFIPIEKIGDDVKNFKHVPGEDTAVTDTLLLDYIQKLSKKKELTVESVINDMFRK